ncbi:MAG: sulfite exporter TauE/SafE family protein [Anaerolineaceae bacterium]|nr:MAG: sulfite exporter TauE/SafE family protein [Chloroflexi bacterium HGW-Chloroflexi-8]
MDLQWFEYIFIGLAATIAGFVNAVAGGGTLITFPVLTAVGLPAVMANVTNTVALCPGYFGATIAQRKDLLSQKKRLWALVPVAIVGGIVGGILLLNSGEKLFSDLVPFLILLASILLAIGEPLKKWLNRKNKTGLVEKQISFWALLFVGLAAVYGGYFGAGLSVIVLAVLGLVLQDSLTKLNALKQAVAFSVNIAAAIFFLFSGNVDWISAAVMAVFALIGGTLGGKLASRISPNVLRWTVVFIGVAVSIIYFLK